MTYQEKVKFLKRYQQIDMEINQLLLEKSEIFALGTKITPTYSNMPKGTGTSDKVQSTIEKLEAQENKINQKVDLLYKVKEDIEKALYTVKDDTLRVLLRYRYINGLTWEKIAVNMHYTYQWVCKLHGEALRNLRVDSN